MATYVNFGFSHGDFRTGSTGPYQLQGSGTGSLTFPEGTYTVGQTFDVRYYVTDSSPGLTGEATFLGYEQATGYPILDIPSWNGGRFFIGTNEPDGIPNYMTTGTIVTNMPFVTCFAPGTWIATPDGERPVETLRPGDKVLTAESRVETVRWVGVQKIPTLFGPREVTHPVRIMAGALYENTPHTDLVVTKDHGMIVDGVICHAGALINGTSIVEVPNRELARDQHGLVTYYHVETENHVPLLANGAAAESFIDHVDRSVFGNHSEFVALYGAVMPAMTEMGLPRAMSARQVPRRVTSLLAERADMILVPVTEGPVAKGSVARSA